jgi:hypothetical protein
MEKFELAWEAITILRNCIGNFKSIRLKQLLTIDNLQPNDDDIYN